jgi:hypothetical protein
MNKRHMDGMNGNTMSFIKREARKQSGRAICCRHATRFEKNSFRSVQMPHLSLHHSYKAQFISNFLSHASSPLFSRYHMPQREKKMFICAISSFRANYESYRLKTAT